MARNLAAILGLPLPGAPQKLIAPDRLAASSLATQQLLDLRLRGDAGVVAARQPERRIAEHAMPAHDHILNRHEHRMAHMQLTSDIWRRHRERKRLPAWVILRLKKPTALPPIVQLLLNLLSLVGFRHLGGALNIWRCHRRAS